jgi:hypothetical protein
LFVVATEVVFIFGETSFTSTARYREWNEYIRAFRRNFEYYMPNLPRVTVAGVNFALPTIIQRELSADETPGPTLADLLHDSDGYVLFRALSISDYAVEVGPHQFALEMGHQQYARLRD